MVPTNAAADLTQTQIVKRTKWEMTYRSSDDK
jgi:hypothetical protein